jgi:putative cobalt transporter subunit CbtA
MRDLPLGSVMRAALLAGVAAGLAAALFNFLLTEPLIDRAIALETLRHQAEGTYEEPMVSRGAQQIGLFVGFLIFGLTWSLLAGAAFHLVQRWMPAWSPLKRSLLVAGLSYWAVALLPGLKYPANPPGVGDPDTIGYRQALYLGFLALSVLATAVAATAAYRYGSRRGWQVGVAVGAALSAALYLAMPANPDTVSMPADLVTTFRFLSVGGLAVFWLVLGTGMGLLLPAERHARRVRLRRSLASRT